MQERAETIGCPWKEGRTSMDDTSMTSPTRELYLAVLTHNIDRIDPMIYERLMSYSPLRTTPLNHTFRL
jgi:hypothetical protein